MKNNSKEALSKVQIIQIVFSLNRHASDTRIGLLDSTVPIEALVNRETYPR